MDPVVTLLIPSAREPRLEETCEALAQALQGLPVHLHVETDPERTGVGATLRRGLARVQTPWVIFVMADGSEDPRVVREMVEACCTRVLPSDFAYDAVWGTRWSRGGTVEGYPAWKRRLNRWGNALISWGLRSAYDDWTDLAKGYRTEILREISWSDDFRCAVEIPLRYRRWHYDRLLPFARMVVPMHWTERTVGRSSYTLGQALKCLLAAVREIGKEP